MLSLGSIILIQLTHISNRHFSVGFLVCIFNGKFKDPDRFLDQEDFSPEISWEEALCGLNLNVPGKWTVNCGALLNEEFIFKIPAHAQVNRDLALQEDRYIDPACICRKGGDLAGGWFGQLWIEGQVGVLDSDRPALPGDLHEARLAENGIHPPN